MRTIIIREARKEEAAQIAQLFLLAWPVEEMARAGGITAEMLLEAVTGFRSARTRYTAIQRHLWLRWQVAAARAKAKAEAARVARER